MWRIDTNAQKIYNKRAMKRVAVILPSDKFQHRQILEGILEYGRAHGPWQFHLELGDRSDLIVGRRRTWLYDGVIAMVSDAARRDEILAHRTPTVLINPPSADSRPLRPPSWAAYVDRDQENVGVTAAEYFLGRGHTEFAFLGTATPASWSSRRLTGFSNRLAKAGFSCRTYEMPESSGAEALALAEWLHALRPGTALYTVDDERALQVLGICSDEGIAVPDTLSVLGTDNDALLCESTTPPLSSIDLEGTSCGTLCARLLDRLMHRRRVEPLVSLAYPRVTTRQSSDAHFIADPFLAKALGIIRQDLAQRHTISDLAAAVGVSKRTLEMKAQQILGTTLQAEINGIRLNEAVRLLSNSSQTVQEVAEKCGFSSASHLGTRLKAAFGYNASVFRYQDPR